MVLIAALYGVSAALLRVIGFGIFLWIARSLPVEDYAQFGLLYALQQGLSTLALAGVSESIIGALKGATAAERFRLYWNGNAAFCVMASASVAFAGFVWVVFFGTDVSPSTFVSVAGSGVLIAFATLQSQLVRFEENHIKSLAFGFVAPLSSVVGGAIGFGFQRGSSAYFWGSLTGLSTALAILAVVGVSLPSAVLDRGMVQRLLQQTVPFVVIAFLGWLSGYGNNYVIHGLFESRDVGNYTFLLSFAAVLLLVAGALNQVWSPRFYRLIEERGFDYVEERNCFFFRLLGMALGGVGGGLLTIFPAAMVVLGGHLAAYEAMSLPLSLIFASYVVLSPWWQCQNHFLFHARGKDVLKVILVTSSLGISVLLCLMWMFGPIGIYLGFFAQMLLRSLGLVAAARRRWDVRISLTGIASGLLLIVAGLILGTSGLAPVIALPAYLAVGSVVALAVLRRDLQKLTRA